MDPSWVVITLCISLMTDGFNTFSYVYLTLHSEQVYTFQTMYSLKVSVQFSLVAQSCPTLCDPMNHSTPGLPVHHQLPEFTQTHIHRVSDAFQPSHPLLLPPIPPSIRVFSNESTLCMRWPKYWGFALASVLPMNTQDWFPLGWTGWISLQFKGLSRVFSDTTVQKHQFFGAQGLQLTLNSLSFFMNLSLCFRMKWRNM